MATPLSIFERLRKMETRSGQSLNALIAEAASVGDALIASIDPVNVRKAAQLLTGHGHALAGERMARMADAQERALEAAHVKPNGNNHRRSA
jgi:hypothetical protein